MLAVAFWITIGILVLLKIVDWRGGKYFENLTGIRTKLFGAFVLGVVVTACIAVFQFLL